MPFGIEIGFLASATVLGIAYAAVPGAVNTEALRRGVAGGFRPAALIQLGALLGAAAWAAVGLTGAAVLLRFDAVAFALGLVGAGFLLALARSAFLAALGRGGSAPATSPEPEPEPDPRSGSGSGLEPVPATSPAPDPARTGGAFAVGLVFGLANPAGIAFWAGVGGGALATGGAPTVEAVAAFLLAFLVGAAAFGVSMAAAVGWGRRFVGGRVFRWVDALCGAALAWFGLRLLVDTLRRLARFAPLLRAAV